MLLGICLGVVADAPGELHSTLLTLSYELFTMKERPASSISLSFSPRQFGTIINPSILGPLLLSHEKTVQLLRELEIC
jgi:hypothetical protein